MRLLKGLGITIFLWTMIMPLSAATETGQTQQKIKWFDDYSKALAEAKHSNKPILLFFTGSDWCGWCKKMDKEIFQTQEFISEAGNVFVFVDVDFPMNKKLPDNLASQNAALKKKFGITGFPTLVILDAKEGFIAETGYRNEGGRAYARYLKELLQ